MAIRCPKSTTGITTLGLFCLFGSGLSSLVYQTTWFREFRYIFGASTAANAAVMAVFMGGLGWGSIVLGKRSDRSRNPLQFYGRLELLITAFAALSPGLVLLVRSFYLWLGGSSTMNPIASVAVRLVLCGVVLFIPSFLMGGTLPAVIAALTNHRQRRRGQVAFCYGANALGALAGVGLATFYLLEHLGNRGTLWLGCLLNAGVALGALALAKSIPAAEEMDAAVSRESALVPTSVWRAKFIYAAAAVTGFGFFLMELVWYRMLGPILGGSTFTFGIILAVALGGISVGSIGAAAILSRWRATTNLFSWLCALQALFLALPFALGDRIALWTMLSQPLGQLSFAARVTQWIITTSLVVFPASLVAGAQFPVLIALLGRGREDLGTHTGRAYAWNTFGAVAGSLAGGFGLLPYLTAPGAWRFVVVTMLFLGLVFVWISVKSDGRSVSRFAPAGLCLLAVVFLAARGPSAVWRHNPIGAGRAKLGDISPNDYERMARNCRQSVLWEAEGKESSVALMGDDGYAFVVNGKSDGDAVGDAGTQVMLGMLGALVHPEPRATCVIGLGTGSTAGWLAQVPSVSRVDVVELEPAIQRVAAACAPVNHDVLHNPKVHLIFRDAREVLLTTRARYDLIVSEPSNPYRAGVASLFTVEFYEAVDRCLAPGGVFVQWLQAYEIDAPSMSTACATLATIFPAVEIWETESGDLALIASREARRYDLSRWRERINQPPFREALSLIWYVNDVEGVFNRLVANDSLCRAVLAAGVRASTDDRNGLEFAVARSVGRDTGFRVDTLREVARTNSWRRPRYIGEPPDEILLLDRQATQFAMQGIPIEDFSSGVPSDLVARSRAKDAMVNGDLEEAEELWESQSKPPSDPFELQLVALALASQGDERALPAIDELRAWRPHDAELIEAHYLWHRGQFHDAVPRIEKLLKTARTFPWLGRALLASSLALLKATEFPPNRRDDLLRLYQSVERPFAVNMSERNRASLCLYLAQQLDFNTNTTFTKTVLESLEPHFPWNAAQLQLRAECYTQLRHPLADQACEELRRFREQETLPFEYLSSKKALKVWARGQR